MRPNFKVSIRMRLILMFWALTIAPLLILTIAVFFLLRNSINIGVNQHLELGLNAAIAIADQSYQEYQNRISFKTVDISYAPELRNLNRWGEAESVFKTAVTSLEVDGLELYDIEGNLITFVTKTSYENRVPLTEKEQVLDALKSNFDLLLRVGQARRTLKTGKTIEDDRGRIIGILIGNKVFPEEYVKNLNTLENNTKFYAEVDLKRRNYFLAFFSAFATLTFAVMVVAVVIAVYLSRRFTHPIAELVAATKELAQGNMDYRLRQKRHDEIGDLVASFNTMANDLAYHRQKLINAERIAAWQGIARRLAHEIKNPLTPIQLSIQHLQDEYEREGDNFSDTFRECTDTIVQEVDGLRKMVQEFSEFARLPAPDFQQIDVKSLITDINSFFSTARSNVDFSLDISRPIPLIEADPEKLRQVLINLIENGIDALKGRATKKISIKVQNINSEQIQIIVKDSGSGISNDHLAKVFQPYFTTKENGTGLGLAIVDRIIQDHNGRISVESSVGNGTSMTITLPIGQ